MFYGIIKSLSERGFGFIEQDNGPDVYFHAAEIGDEVFQKLRLNMPIKFEFTKRKRDENDTRPAEKKGPRAAKLEIIDRIPGGILPPPPQALSSRHHPKARQRKATWKRRINLPGNRDTGTGKPAAEGPSAGDQSAAEEPS